MEDLIRSLRDRVSTDAWRILQGIERDLSEFDQFEKADRPARIPQLLNRLAIEFLAFSGVVAESMTRGYAWRFLDLGSRLERGVTLALLIEASLGHVIADEPALLDAILEIADSSLTYRRRYFTHLDAAAVVDLLVADEANPRSIAYQVAAIESHLGCLPGQTGHPQSRPQNQLILKLRTTLRLADLAAICRQTEKGLRADLSALMNEVVKDLQQVAEYVSQVYFSHAEIAYQLTGSAKAGGES